jgi:hypothetical protein
LIERYTGARHYSHAADRNRLTLIVPRNG